jgi:CubicO group peptidase (beta-lactamase class C family)
MKQRVSRFVYRCVLQMHPRAFQEEFADEMLWIFDEMSGKGSTLPLFADELVSVGRQWLLRGGLRRLAANDGQAPALRTVAGSFAWEHIILPEDRLPARRVMQGSIVAAAFMTVLAFAAVQPVKQLVMAAGFGQAPSAGIGGGISRGVKGGMRGGVAGGVKGGISGGAGGGVNESVGGGVDGGISGGVGGGVADGEGQQAGKTAAERQFAAWLEVFNEGDRAKVLAFLEKDYPEHVKRIDGMMEFREMTGGFDFKKAEDADETKSSGIVKERDSDQFARFEIEVETEEPHKIKTLNLLIVPTPAEFALARLSEADAITALREEIEKRVARDKFAGTVMVTKNGKTIFSGAYGYADREKKIKNELGTQFRIGSMNKMFTAVATLQLAQAGKLKLDAPLGAYLTDYPNKEIATKVTIHQLLTHTGGTGDFFGPQFDAHRLELKTLQDYVKLYGARGPKFEPGSRWEYSNYGFLLLGVIVQKVSGQDYYDYVREHVYKPAGMTATDSLSEDQKVAMRSVGYMRPENGDGGGWKPNTDTLPYRGTSAGGGYSTAGDLQKFAAALRGHKLLDAHYTELLTTGKVETGRTGDDKYAYGFADRKEGGVQSFGHGGGAPGMNGQLDIYPQSGYVVAVLANVDPPAAERIAAFVGKRLPEK